MKRKPVTCDEIIVILATELSRCRVLCDRESRWLEKSLRAHDRAEGRGRAHGPGKPLWNAADDARMMEMANEDITVNQIARCMDKTPSAIRSRIRHLRRREKIGLGGSKTWVR